jgi:hypothetical protein
MAALLARRWILAMIWALSIVATAAMAAAAQRSPSVPRSSLPTTWGSESNEPSMGSRFEGWLSASMPAGWTPCHRL